MSSVDDVDRVKVQSNSHFNLSEALIRNIQQLDYYRFTVANITCIEDLLVEIEHSVDQLTPFEPGRSKQPSKAFCCLYQLFRLACPEIQANTPTTNPSSNRYNSHQANNQTNQELTPLTHPQLLSLLSRKQTNQLIRGLAFLFVRCISPTQLIWSIIQPYIDDNNVVKVEPSSTKQTTVGKYVRKLFTEMDYFGTLLRRIPVPIERAIKLEVSTLFTLIRFFQLII